MPRIWLRLVLIALSAVAVITTCAETSFARIGGHQRYPTGHSTLYPGATSPHGGFSSSNGYYSGRSRIGDPIPVPVFVRPMAPAK